MEEWIEKIVETFGYWGVFGLIALENIFPPIPSEVILTFSGFMTTRTALSVMGVVFFSTLGSVAGAVILYGIGRQLDEARMEYIVERWGKYLRLTKQDLHKTNAWFTKYGVWTVFFCRFVPLIRSLISIPAGMVRMNIGLFLLLTTLGTLIWNFALVYVGTIAGESWESIVAYMDVYSNFVYAALAVLFVIAVVMVVRRRYRKA
ncbi:DedA family protein [Paenibacillus turpanensis]|uniref:DedA family protein n=1 Tax=Paenibacillus turpanensis TaxID=2689078 RepID=UPI001408BBA7|nr:DedA family protein [Paenibacillus turpanensis]